MDKLLDEVKDLSAIKKYLAAINQTTDDYLFAFDIPRNTLQFFGPIGASFAIEQECLLDTFLTVVHPADRKALSADAEQMCAGTKDAHDLDFRMFNRRGETIWANSRARLLFDEDGKPSVAIGRLSEEALRHLFNPVTGLWNKTRLRSDLRKRICTENGWLVFLAIPSLDEINLTHGRDFGDKLLCEMADLLEEIDGIEESYHIDQNNFALVLRECDADAIDAIYAHICAKMNGRCSVYAGAVPIDKKVFIDVSQIIDSAKITLKNAVKNSSGQVVFFSTEDMEKRINELTLLEELKESTQNGYEGFEVHYQPQIKSGSYELYGVEALLRYHSKKRGRVFPDEFIPILEQSGLIDSVGMWVLETALQQCKEWRRDIPDLQVAVNFSSIQFEDARLGEKIVDALKKTGLPGNALSVELTESIKLAENKQYYNIIKYIKSYGVRFSIDDFGTGYSNLGYLKQFEVNEIKIDRSFVTDIEKNTYNYRLISNVIEFAKTNAIHACCEGVETARELSVLEPLEADFFQGYLFDKPCTAEEIAQKYIQTSSACYEARIKAIEEINSFKEQFGAIHFNPQNILSENDIGLWILRLDAKNNCNELHVDRVMKKALGLKKNLSPEECYLYWHSRIAPAYINYVDRALLLMIKSRKAVQLEYRWQHPSDGEVFVRSSGICTQGKGVKLMIEGYHRILTGKEGLLFPDRQ